MQSTGNWMKNLGKTFVSYGKPWFSRTQREQCGSVSDLVLGSILDTYLSFSLEQLLKGPFLTFCLVMHTEMLQVSILKIIVLYCGFHVLVDYNYYCKAQTTAIGVSFYVLCWFYILYTTLASNKFIVISSRALL